MENLTDNQHQADLLNSVIENLNNEFFWISDSSDYFLNIFNSKGAENITGYSCEELKLMKGKNPDLIYKEDREYYEKEIQDLINNPSKNSTEIQYRIKNKNGKIIWILENIYIKRNKSDKPVEFSGSIININDLKRSELRLKKSEHDLRSLNAAKDKFISILSHDLRAPFTSVLGFAEILMNEKELSEKDRKEYLNYIHSSSKNQLQLINYLLDWSRLQTGRIRLETSRISVQALIYTAVSSLTGLAVKKNLKINVNADESHYVLADEKLVTQALTNLISNSIKFSDENREIEISSRLYNEDFVEIIVKDSGTGIPEENKKKLFHIDKTFSTPGTRGEKGTGLGLTLVKEITEKHGGELWFYSEKGKGSEFHLTLPYSSNTIIIVNSIPDEQKQVKALINKKFPQYQVILKNDGYEALDLILNSFPALIVFDHNLPLMDGIQFLELIKKADHMNNIHAIALADEVSFELKKKYENLGIFSLFKKPLNNDLFIKSLFSAFK